MWDERYASDEFIYGTEPNDFLAEHASLLADPVLSLAEGEGRNAVFLATLGHRVLGVDSSAVGLTKAHQLAASRGVSIQTEVVDLATYTPPADTFGAVVSIFAHLPSPMRKRLHQLVVQALKPGGVMLLEGYSKAQVQRGTGGPKDSDMLLSKTEIEQDFSDLEIVLSRELEREVIEGSFHTGLASVVQFIGKKRTGTRLST